MMPIDAIADPHVVDAILAIAGAVATLLVAMGLDLAASDRRRRRRR
ncbi:MAG TPA: hypothetical protein VJ770_28090 [Stellaceae bacterium]|nr:hypothetical protein [Stellaceae bacterium]